MQKNLSELTIIIPSFNRQNFALRSLRYWSEINGPTVHLIDGSAVPIEPQEYDQLSEKVHYHHVEEILYERLKYSFSIIDTVYVVMLGDDEFHLPTGLSMAVEFLEENKDFISCGGRAVEFGRRDSEIVSNGIVYHKFATIRLDHVHPLERISAHFNEYQPYCVYNVTRTEEWIKAFTPVVKKYDWKISYGWDELIFEISIAYLGKVKHLPVLYWLRSSEGTQIHNNLIKNSYPPFPQWWMSLDNCEKKTFLEQITKIIDCEQSNMSNECLDKGFSLYSKKTIYQRLLSLVRSQILYLYINCLPNQMKRIIRNLRIKFGLLSPQQSLMQTSANLKAKGISVDLEEIQIIQNHINNFYKT